MADKEIEIKVQVERSAKLREFLAEHARFDGESRQVDEYFSPPHKDFLAEDPVKEWLRLREEDGRASITYKNWQYDGDTSNWCEEFETSLGDAAQARKILLALGFRSLVTVDKTRRVWRHKDYEIALDTVAGLGDHVELEYKGEAHADPARIVADMQAFLGHLDCGELKRDTRGYPYRLLFPGKE